MPDIIPQEAFGVLIVPLIIGLVQLLKGEGVLPSKYGGRTAVALGLAFNAMLYLRPEGFGVDMVVKVVFWGLTHGLMASGLYSTGKAEAEARLQADH